MAWLRQNLRNGGAFQHLPGKDRGLHLGAPQTIAHAHRRVDSGVPRTDVGSHMARLHALLGAEPVPGALANLFSGFGAREEAFKRWALQLARTAR